jgi:hypothetical protein
VEALAEQMAHLCLCQCGQSHVPPRLAVGRLDAAAGMLCCLLLNPGVPMLTRTHLSPPAALPPRTRCATRPSRPAASTPSPGTPCSAPPLRAMPLGRCTLRRAGCGRGG